MRDPNSGWIQLGSVELFLLWSAMRLGDPPVVLEIAPVGRTPRRLDELIEAASPGLVERELGSVREPARDLAGLLRVLAAAVTSLEMRVYGDGAPLLGFGAVDRRGSAAAVARVGDEVRIGPVRPAALAGALLASLTPLPAGPDHPANVSVADYTAACAAGERDGTSGFLRVLRDAGVRAAEAATVSRVLTSRQGGGQLGADGRVITWVDTPDGRYAMRRDGAWLTVTPVDLPRLTAMAGELLAAV